MIGSVFAHRMFDLFPAIGLVVWVLFTAKIPGWAFTSIALVLVVGICCSSCGDAARAARAPRCARGARAGAPAARARAARARRDALAGRRRDRPASFQFVGWTCQLFAVWAAMFAFHIHEPLSTAGLVLVLINVATIFPLWPGNFGLVQIAVAFPLVNYGVPYARGFAFGIGLQAIEASVGVGVGLIFLAREGLSYAMLKKIDEPVEAAEKELEQEPERARSRVPG